MNGSARTGSVFLLAAVVCAVTAALAVALAEGVGVHLRARQHSEGRAAARLAALGALRAIAADLDAAMAGGGLPRLSAVDPAGIRLDGCTVVLLGRDPARTSPRFALEPLAGRIDANHAPAEALAALPGCDAGIAAAIVDWRDADDTPDPGGGAERSDGAYAGAAVPYAPRNAPIETLDELALVRGMTAALWAGEDRNRNGLLDDGEDADADGRLDAGLGDLLAVETREPATAPDGSPRTPLAEMPRLRQRLVALFGQERGAELARAAQAAQPFTCRLDLLAALAPSAEEAAALWPCLSGPEGRLGLIDPWSCPDEVLGALLGAEAAGRLIAARPAAAPDSPLWMAAALGRDGARAAGRLLTWGSWQWRADLLAVRDDGSGWDRIEALIDCATRRTRVLAIRPAATAPWPLPWATPAQLRAGDGADDPAAFLTAGPR